MKNLTSEQGFLFLNQDVVVSFHYGRQQLHPPRGGA